MTTPHVPPSIQQLSPTTDDGRYWWPGLPPGERIPWDIRLIAAAGNICHYPASKLRESSQWGPLIETDDSSGCTLLPVSSFLEKQLLWFAFPKAHREARWVPLGSTGVRVAALPDVFSLWEARYAIMQLEKLWPVPIRDSSVVNYTQYQPMRRH